MNPTVPTIPNLNPKLDPETDIGNKKGHIKSFLEDNTGLVSSTGQSFVPVLK